MEIKKGQIVKKIPIMKKNAEGKNRMAQKSQKKQKIPRSISKSPLAIYNQ